MNIYKPLSFLLIAGCSTGVIVAQSPDNSYGIVAEESRYTGLSESDYKRVAEELGIEIAVIKAVSDIEAGKNHQGFIAPGLPTLYFSTNMFSNNLRKRGITVPASVRRTSAAFLRLNRKKYGSYGKAQHARLKSAMEIDSVSAILSCYWGMFQIGGFNWKKCGCDSPQDFAAKMSDSELMQLELFAHFVSNNGMLKYLKAKNWYGFARLYNGRYAKRYASRMAAAYKRYK
ncbi:MAG: N-acetylmuramidase family protein [Muribaculaceae bacterium]